MGGFVGGGMVWVGWLGLGFVRNDMYGILRGNGG